jgi:hypothetical protein
LDPTSSAVTRVTVRLLVRPDSEQARRSSCMVLAFAGARELIRTTEAGGRPIAMVAA